MTERIQKILSSRGVTSRRDAEHLIQVGRITCNGRICQIGDSADPDRDIICLDGKPIPSKPQNVYIMLNKPRGYVTTLSDEKGRANAAQLVSDCGHRVYPVGRLDMDSEGLLLFTNDGVLANRMMHPKHEVNKVYLVEVGDYTETALLRLQEPIILDGYRIKKPTVSFVRAKGMRAVLRIVIHEGRNRQVRRMCAAAGLSVFRLKRVCEGALQLGDLPLGKWRYLTEQEISML